MPTVAADATQGILPALNPLLVRESSTTEWGNANQPLITLVSAKQGVYAELILQDANGNFSVVETWNDPQANLALASRIILGQAIQLRTSASLSPGNYSVVVFPTGANGNDFTQAGNIIANEVTMSYLGIQAAHGINFTVDSSGQINVLTTKRGENLMILLDVISSPTYACTQHIGQFDPLMIDFSGKGISLSSQFDGIRFDMTGDGQIRAGVLAAQSAQYVPSSWYHRARLHQRREFLWGLHARFEWRT